MAKFDQIEKLLKQKKIDFKVINFPKVAVSVEDVVALAGDQVERDEITKALIIKLKCGDFVACIIKGEDRLDKNVLLSDGTHSNQPVSRLATKEEILRIAGVEIGAVCPILLDIPVIFDGKVMSLSRVNLGSGDLLKGLEMNFADLISLLPNYKVGELREDKKQKRILTLRQAQGENTKKRILTGTRPTYDSFHLGNFVGSLANLIKLQDEYEMFIPIVDLHALTTHFDKTADLAKNIRGLMLGYLSVGLDPQKVTFILQSKVPEVLELAYFLSILTPRPVIERQPALKEKLDQGNQDTVGLYYYPILMAADILLPKANLVPVGKDQKAHVEFARDIAIKFNNLYGEVFPLPEPLIGEVPMLPGTDGQAKMGKSSGNAIFLTDSAEVVQKKVMGMYTDPKRIHPTDPGTVEGNPVFVYLDAFASETGNKQHVTRVGGLKEKYKKGEIKDVEVKQFLVEVLEGFLAPIRKRRAEFEKQPELVDKILREGTQKARVEAQKTLAEVKAAMKLNYFL